MENDYYFAVSGFPRWYEYDIKVREEKDGNIGIHLNHLFLSLTKKQAKKLFEALSVELAKLTREEVKHD